jgi:hypothetical protein
LNKSVLVSMLNIDTNSDLFNTISIPLFKKEHPLQQYCLRLPEQLEMFQKE